MAENDQQARPGWLHSVLVSVLVALLAGGSSPWWWADLKTALQGGASVDKHEAPMAAGPAATTEAPQPQTSRDHTALQQVDQGSVTDSDMLAALGKAGVTFSVDRAIINAWLHDSNTPYPAIGVGLLELLKGKQLSRPVPLDGIVYDYQQAAGTEKTDTIDLARLKTAVLRRYNTEYGTGAKYFDELLQ